MFSIACVGESNHGLITAVLAFQPLAAPFHCMVMTRLNSPESKVANIVFLRAECRRLDENGLKDPG
jgi:hypothetical protein